jgi:hypothetical protein
MTKKGILYVLLFELEGKTLVKIGVTTRSIEERVAEILVSMFTKYRMFPYCYPKRFRTTEDIFGKEKKLHKMFEEHKHVTSKKFSGYTEFFDVDVDEVVKEYDKLIKVKKYIPKNKKKKKKGVFFIANKIL